MTERIPPLVPWPLRRLLERIAVEWETKGEIFNLAGRRFWRADPDVDLGWDLHGARIATPVGPAAGPHTQLAQNIVLSWLGGARTFELKTIQILDELDIPRPCIDMEDVGYNVEWSQELTLEQSLEEYAKSWLLLAVLREWEPLREALGDGGDYAFELSVGYDLAGIRHERMARTIAGLLDARERMDRLRGEITGPFAALRDVEVPARTVAHATLSTFHGCPPDEIEGIVKHLMTAHGLDVTVKLNPTLLGPAGVAEILHERLGYTDVALRPSAFAQDLEFDRALALIGTLRDFAAAEGRTFGIKLTNTLVVENRRGVMPGEEMYLSGRPLHVLAVAVLEKLQSALPGTFALGPDPGPVPVAFSAGIDKDNLAEAVALGLRPVTICSDLLRPGGYGRMAQGLRKLARTMKEQGVPDLAGLGARAHAAARAGGHRDAVAALAARHATPEGAAPYTREGGGKPLRQVDHVLEVFDCVACTNCVTVCPNDAFWQTPTGDLEGLEARAQYLVLSELCNECGNCVTFCPEEGEPWRIKPRLFTGEDAWSADGGDGYLVTVEEGRVVVRGPDPAAGERVRRLVAGEAWLVAALGAAGRP